MPDILFKEECYNIIGACMNVHRKLGPGFLESVYSEALELEFQKIGIPYEKEKKLLVYYEKKPLNKYFRADYVCYDSIILELKATNYIIMADRKQTYNNVRATDFKLGLLVNFGEPSLRYFRMLHPVLIHH